MGQVAKRHTPRTLEVNVGYFLTVESLAITVLLKNDTYCKELDMFQKMMRPYDSRNEQKPPEIVFINVSAIVITPRHCDVTPLLPTDLNDPRKFPFIAPHPVSS